MELPEKGYYMNKLEWSILLKADAIDRIYSFELPKKEQISAEQIIMAAYGLIKSGLAVMTDDGLLPCAELKELLQPVRDAAYALTIVPRDEAGTQKICYLSGTVTVTELTEREDEIRVRKSAWEDFAGYLFEQLDDSVLCYDSDAEADRISRYDSSIRQEHEALKAAPPIPLAEDMLQWLDRQEVWFLLELADLTTRQVCCRCIFIEGRLNSWIYVQEPNRGEVYFDTRECRKRLFQRMEKIKEGI